MVVALRTLGQLNTFQYLCATYPDAITLPCQRTLTFLICYVYFKKCGSIKVNM